MNWGLTQAYLLECPSDVLVLLDTCFAGKGGSNTAGATKGANEVIAATNENSLAPGVSRFSFTEVLVRVLGNFAERHRTKDEHLSAVWLAAHMRIHYTRQELQKIPYYVSLVDYKFESCLLVPRRHTEHAFLGDITSYIAPAIEPHRVLVAIHLNKTPDGDVVTWLQGQGAPPGYITGIELNHIESLYVANSALLLVKVPLTVWMMLPSKLACTFVGLVRSENLLKTNSAPPDPAVTPSSKAMASARDFVQLDPFDPLPSCEATTVLSSIEVLTSTIRRKNQNPYSQSLQYEIMERRAHLSYMRINPLRQIRLLRLRAGSGEDALFGELLTPSLSEAPRFMALSYVWEQGQGQQSIIIDGNKMHLEEDLGYALLALRKPEQPILIWVDSICINPHDVEERNSQDMLLAEIYKQADSIIVWLGQKTSYSEVAFATANWLARNPDLICIIPPEDLVLFLVALFALMRNPWFRRRSTVMHIAFGKTITIQYGYDTLPWQVFADAMCILRYRASDLRHLVQQAKCPDDVVEMLDNFSAQNAIKYVDLRYDLQQAETRPWNAKDAVSLPSLVARTALLTSSDPRDVISLMVHIAVTLEGRRIRGLHTTRIDAPTTDTNTKELLSKMMQTVMASRSYAQSGYIVFSSFVRLTVAETNSLDIICTPWAPKEVDLPSWIQTTKGHPFKVLDDNRCSRVNADCLADISSVRRYNASGPRKLPPELRIAESTSFPIRLVVSGVQVGIVDSEMSAALNGTIPAEWRDVCGWDFDSKTPSDDFWRILVADCDPSGQPAPAWYALACENAFRGVLRGDDLDTQRSINLSSPGMVRDFLSRVQTVTWGRKLLMTKEKQYLGLAPGDCQKGDVLCILFGCSVPVILRSYQGSETGQNLFKLIGECYIHGIMNGEGISKTSQETEFVII